MWEFEPLGAMAEPRAAPGTFGPSQEELQDYADEVNRFIRDMQAHVLRVGDGQYSAEAKAYAVRPWMVPFLAEWTELYNGIPDVWLQSSAWEEVRAAHSKALEHKRQFERHGVAFTTQVAPGKEEPLQAPPPPRTPEKQEKEEESADVNGGKGKIGYAKAAIGLVAGGLAIVAGFSIGKLVGIAYGGRR
jgi:hypothetical protein